VLLEDHRPSFAYYEKKKNAIIGQVVVSREETASDTAEWVTVVGWPHRAILGSGSDSDSVQFQLFGPIEIVFRREAGEAGATVE
jgi:hypothetical protein